MPKTKLKIASEYCDKILENVNSRVLHSFFFQFSTLISITNNHVSTKILWKSFKTDFIPLAFLYFFSRTTIPSNLSCRNHLQSSSRCAKFAKNILQHTEQTTNRRNSMHSEGLKKDMPWETQYQFFNSSYNFPYRPTKYF